MKNQVSAYRMAARTAFSGIVNTTVVARRAGPVAALCLVVLMTLGVVLLGAFRTPAGPQATSASSTPTFTVFDAPGAGTGMIQGTMGTSINDGGDIAGVYLTTHLTAANVAHGFVRSVVNGTPTFATFDAPNAGTGLNQGTFPASINTAGDVAGMYFDANNAYHGFVRVAAGTITEFDVPGAPTTLGHRGTVPLSMNTGGVITGFYVDGSDVRHGFVRAAGGTFTTFDVPGAGTGLTEGTVPLSIDTAGDITGFYKDAVGTFHGFLRAGATGTITAPIDAPGAGICCGGKIAFKGTLPLSFDTAGDIGGIYADSNSVNHGFVRAAGGTFTTFDVPGAGTSATFTFPGTLPLSMNAGGDISGIYTDTNGVRHGFMRTATGGAFTAPIDAPGASTSGMLSGTVLISINTAGDITGTFSDTNNVFHGFLLAPAQTGQAATPTFSPAPGTYPPGLMVTISDTTTGATISYTTDGSTPSPGCAACTVFTTPITLNSTTTIKAIAAAPGFSNSAVATAAYLIAPPAPTPTFSPAPGTYTSAQMVTISDTTAGATIHFTTNGNTPTSSDTVFTTPISINTTTTFKAIAVASGFSQSAVATGLYTINLPTPDFQLSVNPTTLTIVAGKSGNATFTVTPQNGFSSQVSFACTGLPSEASCTFNPPSVTPSGAAASSTLTITTTAPGSAMFVPLAPSQRPFYALLFPVLAAVLALVLALIFVTATRRSPALRGVPLFGLLILLTVASVLASCNGASNPGTPVGTSALSVSASASGAGAVSHTATLTVTITH